MRIEHLPLLITLCLAAACGSEGGYKLPGVYRVDVQQGNIIQQEMLDKLKPGMDKNQVRFIMGTPALADPFHSDRWEYVYTMSENGRRREQRHLTLHFTEEKLSHISGDIAVAEPRPEDEIDKTASSASVDVPLKNSKGFLHKLFSSLPFVEDDKPQREHTPATDQDAGGGGIDSGDPVGSQ